MPDDLMRYPTVYDELNREAAMLQHSLMATLHDVGEELLSGAFCDFVLALVADSAALLQTLHDDLAIDGRDKLKTRFDNFHYFSIFLFSAATL